MRSIYATLTLLLFGLSLNAREFITRANTGNFKQFNLNPKFLKITEAQNKELYVIHDELLNVIDLKIYDSDVFNEARVDNTIGGG